MEKNKTIKLYVAYQEDREKLILALANSGYKVWIEKEFDQIQNNFFVCFELK